MKGCVGLGLALWCLALGTAQAQDKQRVSLEFQDAPVTVILQALADYRQMNLIAAPGVSGNLTLRLENVPWPQALALTLRMGKLAMTREGNVILISPEPDAQEKRQQREALAQRQPLHSLTLTLQNGDAAEIAESLNAQRGALLSERGSVLADKRTNTLLLRDTAPILTQLKKRVTEMDAPLAQVQLAAHIVTINRESLRELGVRWGLASDDRPARPLRPGNVGVNLPLERSAVNAGFHLARISGRLLSLELTALEQENQVEIIASPRLLTAHLQTASIKQGTEIPYEVSSGASGATAIEFKEAVLGMEVTPTVLQQGRVRLKLRISENTPGQVLKQENGEALAIDKQEIETLVEVRSGETLALGGIFSQKNKTARDSVPLLGDIPVLGRLFRRDGKDNERRELVVFITPRILAVR